MPGRKKARLCISDPKFLQRFNNLDTFSPMCRIETVRFLLSCVVERQWELGALDIKNAFPISSLDDPVWMEVPRMLLEEKNPDGSLKNPSLADCYCYVEKSLYGLAVSPRCWNKHLDKKLRKHGYITDDADACLYMKYDKNGNVAIAIATFVDDCLFGGTPEAVAEFRRIMRKSEDNADGFDIVDSGVPTDFLALDIDYKPEEGTLKISHEKYLTKAGIKYGITDDTKHASVPLSYDKRLEPCTDDDERCDATLYKSIVGTMVFSVVSVRADAAEAVRELSKFLYDPSVTHMKEAMKCLAYLVQTKTMGITYEHGDHIGVHGELVPNGTMEMFTDASFADDLRTRHSTSGYAAVKNRAVITWGSKSQSKVALSTGDAELRALCRAYAEVRWLRKLQFLFSDHTVRSKHLEENEEALPPTTIWEDNKSTISWVKNPVAHDKLKHIDVPLKALREAQTEHYSVNIKFIPTHQQLADGMTKALTPALHYKVMAPLLNWRSTSGIRTTGAAAAAFCREAPRRRC